MSALPWPLSPIGVGRMEHSRGIFDEHPQRWPTSGSGKAVVLMYHSNLLAVLGDSIFTEMRPVRKIRQQQEHMISQPAIWHKSNAFSVPSKPPPPTPCPLCPDKLKCMAQFAEGKSNSISQYNEGSWVLSCPPTYWSLEDWKDESVLGVCFYR